MSRLPICSAKKVIAALKKAGFFIIHQRGSHIRLRHHESGLTVTVPYHAGDVPISTLRRIINQAELTVDEFKNLL